MAIIPRTKENTRVEPRNPVPIAGTSDARIAGEALSSAGQGLFSLGKAMYQKQDEMEKIVNYQQGANDIQNAAVEGHEHARLNSAPDGSDYGQKYKEYVEPKITKAMNQYGGNSLKTRQDLQALVERSRGTAETSVMIKSLQLRENYNFEQLESTADQSAGRVRSQPDPEMVEAEIRDYGGTLDKLATQGIIASDKIGKARQAYYGKVAENYVQGLSDQQQFTEALSFLEAGQESSDMFTSLDPEQAQKLGFIDGREASALKEKGAAYQVPIMTKESKKGKVTLTPALSAVSNGLSDAQRDQLINQMRAKAEEYTSVRLADLNAQVNGFEKIALNGGSYSEKQVAELKQSVNYASNMTPLAKKRVMDSINSADAVNKQMKLIANTPRSQWNKVVAGADRAMGLAAKEAAKIDPRMGEVEGDFAVQANRMQNKEVLMRALESMKKEQESDPAKFVLENDQRFEMLRRGTLDNDPQGTNNYASALLEKQKYLGIPDSKQRITTKAEATHIADQLENMPSSQDAANTISALEQKYGDHFPRVMSEITSVNKDLEKYKYTVYADPDARNLLVDSIRNKQGIMKVIDSDARLKSQKGIVANASSVAMDRFRKATVESMNDSGAANFSAEAQEQIETLVYRDLSRNPEANVTDLTKKAYDTVIGRNYDVVGANRSSVLVPKVIKGQHINSENISEFINNFSGPKGFKELGVELPADFNRNEDTQEAFYKGLRWVTTKDQSGVTLKYVDPAGRFIPAYDKYGKQITKGYRDISLNPPRRKNQTFLGSLFGGD